MSEFARGCAAAALYVAKDDNSRKDLFSPTILPMPPAPSRPVVVCPLEVLSLPLG